MRQLTLKYPGKCNGCGLALRKGDTAVWSKATKAVYCTNCAKGETTDHGLKHMTDLDSQFEDMCAERCGR